MGLKVEWRSICRYNLGPGGRCRPGRCPLRPPGCQVKAKPTPALLILLIERSARKSYVLATWDVFLGFEDPVLSCLTVN